MPWSPSAVADRQVSAARVERRHLRIEVQVGGAARFKVPQGTAGAVQVGSD